jgi:hypothetical protein
MGNRLQRHPRRARHRCDTAPPDYGFRIYIADCAELAELARSRLRSDIGAVDMGRFIIAAILAVALCPGSAMAQVGAGGGAPTPSPLGMTSPLGLGAAPPVAPTGIPLGAAELTIPGTSPGTSPSGLATSDISVCSGFGGSIPQVSFGAPITGTSSATGSTTPSTTGLATTFDGGNTGTVSGTCMSGASTALARPTASASSPTGMVAAAPVGRVGIPMGSTELGAGGLSPPPLLTSSTSISSTSSPSVAGSSTSLVGAPVSTAPAVSRPSPPLSTASSSTAVQGSQ